MWQKYNPNPQCSRVGDCTVRALSKALSSDWDNTYLELCIYGLICSDMPSSNYVWGRMLQGHGFKRQVIPDTCPDCYTLRTFAKEHPNGIYVVGLNGHVVTICNGDYYDTWDSGDEVPVYYWHKE